MTWNKIPEPETSFLVTTTIIALMLLIGGIMINF